MFRFQLLLQRLLLLLTLAVDCLLYLVKEALHHGALVTKQLLELVQSVVLEATAVEYRAVALALAFQQVFR